MGIFEKRKFKNFLNYCSQDNVESKGFNPKTETAQKLYDEYKLDINTQSVTGHALAMHLTDEYVLQSYL